MVKTEAGDRTSPAEGALYALLRDAPTEEDLRASLPSGEELTAAIDRLLADAGADS